MKYQNINNKSIVDYSELQALYPNSALPKNKTELILDYHAIATSDKPDFDAITQIVIELEPTNFVQTWSIVQLSEASVLINKKKLIKTAIQTMLDNSSKSRGYSSVISECSYATSTGSFGIEAQITVDWRNNVWTKTNEIQELFLSGHPATIAEFMLLLPVRVQ